MRKLSMLLTSILAATTAFADDGWTLFITNHPEANYINSWDTHTPSPVPYPLTEIEGTDGFKFYRADEDAESKTFKNIQLSKIDDSNTWYNSDNLILQGVTDGNIAMLYVWNDGDEVKYSYYGDFSIWAFNQDKIAREDPSAGGIEINFYNDPEQGPLYYRTETLKHTSGDKLWGFKKENPKDQTGNKQWHTNPTADLSADGATMDINPTTSSNEFQELSLNYGASYFFELDLVAMVVRMHIVDPGDPDAHPLYLHVNDSGNDLKWTNDFFLGVNAGVDYTAEVTTSDDMYLIFSQFPTQSDNDWYWHDGLYAPAGDIDILPDGTQHTVAQNAGSGCYKLTGVGKGTWIVTARYSDDFSSVIFSVKPKPRDEKIYIWSAPAWTGHLEFTRNENLDYTCTFTASETGTQYFLFTALRPDVTPEGTIGDYSSATFGAEADGALTVNSGEQATAILGSTTPFSFKVTKGASYTVTLSSFNGTSFLVEVTSPDVVPPVTDTLNQEEGKYWYLSGDINTWSSLKELPDNMGRYGKDFLGEISHSADNGGGSEIWDPNTTPKLDNGDTYFDYRPEAGQQPARFASVEEMNTLWRFRDALPSEVKAAGLEGDGWLLLDLRQTTDAAGNHSRLCGQFKFTQGWLEHNAVNFSCRVTDLSAPVHAGEIYTQVAYGEEVVDGGVYIYGNNFYLDATYIEDPVIYLNPDLMQFLVTGTEKDAYIYYVHLTDTESQAPVFIDMNSGSQYNYIYPDNYGMNSEDPSYNWELLPDGADYAYDPLDPSATIHFDRVWRKKIPSACIHRSPMPFTVSVISAQGTEFTPVRVECSDEWFIEGDQVHLYLRYEDPSRTPAAVYSNAYINVYNESNEIEGQNYQYPDFQLMTPDQPAGDNAPDEYADPNLRWFMSPEPVDLKWASGGYALFLTSRGELYPEGGIYATSEQRARVALNGIDLYYVIPKVNNPRILYSHLNGTYSISRDGENNLIDTPDGPSRQVIQVNAELYHEDHQIWGNTLDTQIDDTIRYHFRILNDTTGDSWESTDPSLPFYDWDVTEAVPGFYSVIVTVTKNGIDYVARDIYPIAQ